MDDFFSEKVADFKSDPLPKPAQVTHDNRRANLEGPLEQARIHLRQIQHNPRAVAIQEKIIQGYVDRLRELDKSTSEDWLK